MTHRVQIEVKGRRFHYDIPCLCVKPGDRIEWKLKNRCPYGLVVKSPVSPLDWSFKTTGSGKKIAARVNRMAMPGFYPYAVGVYDGTRLLFDDPDIIVRRP